MMPRKRIIIPLIALAACAIWLSVHQRIRETQRAVELTRVELLDAIKRIEAANRKLVSLQDQLRRQKANRAEIVAAGDRIQRELLQKYPESRWAEPPPELPHWDAESPFIWVRKQLMENVHREVFGKDGSLAPEAVPVLAIEPQQVRRLNKTLPAILAAYRELEAGTVEYSDKHLSGIGRPDGSTTITITWKPPAEEGSRFKEQYESVLRDVLGEQRAQLLLSVHGGLDTEFGQAADDQEQKISVVSARDGGVGISIQRGDDSFSMGAPYELRQEAFEEIPPHLRRFFAGLIDIVE